MRRAVVDKWTVLHPYTSTIFKLKVPHQSVVRATGETNRQGGGHAVICTSSSPLNGSRDWVRGAGNSSCRVGG